MCGQSNIINSMTQAARLRLFFLLRLTHESIADRISQLSHVDQESLMLYASICAACPQHGGSLVGISVIINSTNTGKRL
jgi:hypothetical protein